MKGPESFEDLAAVIAVCLGTARSDGKLLADELNTILDGLKAQYDFEGQDDLLQDYLDEAEKMDLKEAIERIKQFGPEEKQFTSDMLFMTIAADGELSPDEEEIYKGMVDYCGLPMFSGADSVNEEATTWPDEEDGVPYNMDWDEIDNWYGEQDKELGIKALHGDPAALAQYGKMMLDDDVYYEYLLSIDTDPSEDETIDGYSDDYWTGKDLYLDDKYTEAIPYLMKAAKRGNEYAMYYLGCCWFEYWNNGDGEETECWLKAFEWFLKGAVKWNADCCFKLGEAYYYGRIPNEDGELDYQDDYEAAAFWFRQAITFGNVSAASYLGGMYIDGEGVEKDERKGFETYKKATEMAPDSGISWYNLGIAYEKGYGVTPSDEEASKCYWKGKDSYPECKARYAILLYNNNPGQRQYAISLLKEANEKFSPTAERALKQLGEL